MGLQLSPVVASGAAGGGGGGPVTGPLSSTDNAVVRWDGVTGNIIQDSGVILSDLNTYNQDISFTSDPGSDQIAFDSDMDIGNAGTYSDNYIGMDYLVATNGTVNLDNASNGILAGSFDVAHRSTGTLTDASALLAVVSNVNTGTITAARGIEIQGNNNGGGTFTDFVGIKFSDNGVQPTATIAFDFEGNYIDVTGTSIRARDDGATRFIPLSVDSNGISFNSQDLELKTAITGDILLQAASEILLVDGNKAGSTFTSTLKLTETSAEWDTYEVLFGEVSIFNALNQLGTSGSGDVMGPASSTDNAVVRFDGVTGKIIQDSSFFISDDNGITTLASTITADNDTGFKVTATSGGDFANISGIEIDFTTGGMLTGGDFAYAQKILLNTNAADASGTIAFGSAVINDNASGAASSIFGYIADLNGTVGTEPTNTGNITGYNAQVGTSVAGGTLRGFEATISNDTAATANMYGMELVILPNIAGITNVVGVKVSNQGTQSGDSAFLVNGDWGVAYDTASTFTTGLNLADATITGNAIELPNTNGTVNVDNGLLSIKTTTGGDVILSSAGEIRFHDTNKGLSTYAGIFKLSETSGEWDTFETNFGEVSLINAINQAAAAGDVSGPGSSTDDEIVRFDGTTGKLIKNSGIVFLSSTGTFSTVDQGAVTVDGEDIVFEPGDGGTVGETDGGGIDINLGAANSTGVPGQFSVAGTVNNPTFTPTMASFIQTLTPTANSTVGNVGLQMKQNYTGTFDLTNTGLGQSPLFIEFDADGTGTISEINGISNAFSSSAASTITDYHGITFSTSINAATTFTNYYGFHLKNHSITQPTNTYFLRIDSSSHWLSSGRAFPVLNGVAEEYLVLSQEDTGLVFDNATIQVKTTTAGSIRLISANNMIFEDGQKAGSTFTSTLVLSDTSAEWNDFETEFGEVSILNAIVQAKTAGTGDVNGPASSTDHAIARFDGVTGKIIQNTSGITIDDDNRVSHTATLGQPTAASEAYDLFFQHSLTGAAAVNVTGINSTTTVDGNTFSMTSTLSSINAAASWQDAGTLSFANAYSGTISNGTGTITNARGVSVSATNSGTITNFTAFRAGNIGGTNPTNTYVLEVGSDYISNNFTYGLSSSLTGYFQPFSTTNTGLTWDSQALTLETTTTGNINIQAASEILLADGNKSGSTFTSALKLSETSAEWSTYETNYGEVSLLNALNQAASGNGFGTDYAAAYDTTTQTVAVANTFQDVTFNTNVVLDGWTHTASTANFTCATTGKYLVTYSAHIEKTSGGNSTGELILVNNGAQVAGSQAVAIITSNNFINRVSGSMVVSMTATQVLKVQFTGSNTATRIVPPAGVATVDSGISVTITKIS